MADRPRVFVTRKLPGAALERLEQQTQLDVWTDPLPPPPEQMRTKARDARGLLTMLTDRVDGALLEAAPSLKVVSNYAAGLDNLDLRACAARGVVVGHTPGALTETTADLAFALLLSAARRLSEGEGYVRAGRWHTWEPSLFLGRDVHGATLGIAGMGLIGQAVARRARGFGMRVLYTARRDLTSVPGERVSKDALLAQSDFLSLHLPLTPETNGYLGREELRRMKPGSILVNTGRGKLVDPEALMEALRDGPLAGAALDVTDPEPLPADHPLLSRPNALVVPHLGSASEQTRSRMAELAVDNLLAGLRGEALPHAAPLP